MTALLIAVAATLAGAAVTYLALAAPASDCSSCSGPSRRRVVGAWVSRNDGPGATFAFSLPRD